MKYKVIKQGQYDKGDYGQILHTCDDLEDAADFVFKNEQELAQVVIYEALGESAFYCALSYEEDGMWEEDPTEWYHISEMQA